MSRFQFSAFLAILTSFLVVGFLYLDLSLLKRLLPARRARQIARIALAGLLGLQFVVQPVYRGSIPYTWSGPGWAFSWVSFTFLGFAAFLFSYSFFADAGRALWVVYERLSTRFGVAGIDSSKRLWLTRQVPAVIVGASAFSTLGGVLQARVVPSVETVEVPIPGLPIEFDGFSIAQISDLHIGPTIGSSFVHEVVARTNAADADVIALTGDMVDGFTKQLRAVHSVLGQLRARDGVYFVTGNHEYFWNAPEWLEEYPGLGIVPLTNENRLIHRGRAELAIGGIPDVIANRFVPSHVPDIRRAFEGVSGAAVKVLLAHQPGPVFEALREEVHLQLSGHTHAGQFYPFNFFVRLAYKHYKGLYTIHSQGGHRTTLYVNRGTGYWGPPIRLGVSPEITKIVLRREIV